MTGKDKLVSFKKMWTWLCGYPAHDREYYMKNVVKLSQFWQNSCPLSNSSGEDCDGCRSIWHSKTGTLCTDRESPLYKWKNTSRQRPDDRSFFASHIAVLAMNALSEPEDNSEVTNLSNSDYIESQLHG